MKLNGWIRIGIIFSVIWILGAGYHTFVTEDNDYSTFMGHYEWAPCYLRANADDSQTEWTACDNRMIQDRALEMSIEHEDFFIWAFIPIIIVWPSAFFTFFLIGWVKRGF